MSFRINPSRPFAEEVKRTGLELIDDAISILTDQPDGPHAAVHEARKRFKRMRALYRFLHMVAPDFRRSENARFRDIARSLASARDAAALVETTLYLQGFSRSDVERGALAAVRTRLVEQRDAQAQEAFDLPARIEAAIHQCRQGRDALCALSLPHRDKAVARLVKKTWAKQRETALDALAACHAQAHDENFHELRKSGQVYWMHLALLRRIWPSAMRAKRTGAKHLVQLLGHEHDLSVLAAFADREAERFCEGEMLALLLDAIIARQQALREESLSLAALVFAETAATESGIVALLWTYSAT